MPEDVTITYAANHERTRNRDQLLIYVSRPDGTQWEFVVEQCIYVHDRTNPYGPAYHNAIRIEIFNDACQVFTAIPEFFAQMAELQPTRLNDVRTILVRLGAIDQSKP